MAKGKRFSTIGLSPMVESVNRKFARRIDTSYNKTFPKGLNGNNEVAIPGNTFMGCSTREVNVIGVGTLKKHIMFFHRPMNEPVATSAVLAARTNFSEVAEWVKTRLMDLSVIANDRQKFVEGKADFSKRIKGVATYGYEGMRGWLFAIGMAYKKAGAELPSGAFTWDA